MDIIFLCVIEFNYQSSVPVEIHVLYIWLNDQEISYSLTKKMCRYLFVFVSFVYQSYLSFIFSLFHDNPTSLKYKSDEKLASTLNVAAVGASLRLLMSFVIQSA